MSKDLWKKNTKTQISGLQLSTKGSQSSSLIKKKNVTFKKSFVTICRKNDDLTVNGHKDYHLTMKYETSGGLSHKDKKLRTCGFFCSNVLENRQKEKGKTVEYKKIQKGIFKNVDQQSKQLILQMFKSKPCSTLGSTDQLQDFQSTGFIQESIMGQNKQIRKTINQQGAFGWIDQQVQKGKQMKRVKSLHGLQKMAKDMIRELNNKTKYDSESIMQRQKYMSLFHTRHESSIFKLNNNSSDSRNFHHNRSKMEKGHSRSRSVNITSEYEKQKTKNQFDNLIQQCKNVQNQQNIKKEISLFSTFSRYFDKKCERKIKRIEGIEKSMI